MDKTAVIQQKLENFVRLMRVFETHLIQKNLSGDVDKMTPPRLFYARMSPPSRMVQIVARKIGLELDLKHVNVDAGELNSQDFLEINPQHCLPTLDDNGLVLWESRAIAMYLISSYAVNDELYPKDPRRRAMVDHMLQFDLGTVYARINDYYGDILYKKKPLDPEKLTSLTESIDIFDKILSKRKWAASETTLTLADISLCQSFCQLDAFEFDFQRFQRVSSWYKATQHKLKSYGYEEINVAVMLQWREMLKSKLVKESNGVFRKK